MLKCKFNNSYITSAISVSLVLCLIGLECILLLSAGELLTRMREDITITAVLAQDTDSTKCAQLETILQSSKSYSCFTYISCEQALQEHIAALGEDPTEFLGYNPLSASYEIHPTDLYSHPDSLTALAVQLQSLSYITEVIYPRDLADVMSSNINELSLFLFVVACILLVVSMVLFINTIRLQIYSQRFIINTMTLVGATPWVVRRPFVLRNMLMGVISGIVALVVLGGVVYYVQYRLGVMLFSLQWYNIAFVSGVVLVSSMLITLFASLIATRRYIHMDNNSLYEI